MEPRISRRSGRKSTRTSRFNEAGAMEPRISGPRRGRHGCPWRFNEAGAMEPRISVARTMGVTLLMELQ